MKNNRKLLGISALFFIAVLSVSLISAYDSGWNGIRTKNDYYVCGKYYQTCTLSGLGLDWYTPINGYAYDLICGELSEADRRDCLLWGNGGIGRYIDSSSYGTNYLMIKTAYEVNSAGTDETMKGGITANWNQNGRNIADLGSGYKTCVFKDAFVINDLNNKFWLVGTGGSVNPYSFRITSCIPDETGLVYCDDGTPAVSNCPIDNDGDGYNSTVDCNDNNPLVHPNAFEACNGIDDNCVNGIDEGFNLGATCNVGLGACGRTGSLVCSTDGLSSQCNVNPGLPSVETCNNLDDNCDGTIDNGIANILTCNQNGLCSGNSLFCSAGNWFNNSNNYFPVAEVCDGFDNNCDGQVDEGNVCGWECVPGTVRDCGIDVGECSFGTQTCSSTHSWGSCIGAVNPVSEICDNKDNDCDGQVDEGNICNQTNGTIPLVLIVSPQNLTYNYSLINVSVLSDQVINTWAYNLDNQVLWAVFNPGQLMNFTNGTHTLRISATNTNGTGYASVVFSVALGSSVNQTNQTLPVITVYSPINGYTYNYTRINLSVSANQVIDNWYYVLNGGVLTSFTPNTTITGKQGNNVLVIYARNANGTSSVTVNFRIDVNNCDDEDDYENEQEQEDVTNTIDQLEHISSENTHLILNQTIDLSLDKKENVIQNWIYWIFVAILVLLIVLVLIYIVKYL